MSYEIEYSGPITDLEVDVRNRKLRRLLHEHDCEVTFTKVDGTVRSMPCTLRPTALPVQVVTESDKTKVYKPETLSVWCLDAKAWRSFRVANVTKIRVIQEAEDE
jgi:hypothetical protein